MLIRSQNKQNIFNINTISGIGFGEYSGDYPYQIYALVNGEYLLGKYSSKEKAIRVLDMILEEYQVPTYINDQGGGEYANYWQKVFHMPENDEV
jgi:hypothetical protein